MGKDQPRKRFHRSKLFWFGTTSLALYLILGNSLLRTQWLQQILSRKPSLNISWKNGYTLFPGHVQLAGLKLEGNPRLTKWQVSAERAHGWINLFALPFKSFQAYGVDGEGVVSEIQRKTNPPPKKHRPPGWKIGLHGLAVDRVNRLQFDQFLLECDGRVRGSAEFQVRGLIHMQELGIDFRHGNLTQKGSVIGSQLQLQVDAGLAPFKTGQYAPRAMWDLASGQVKIDAQITSLGFLSALLERAPWLALKGGGHLNGQLHLDKGRILAPSKIHIGDGSIQAHYLDTVVAGKAIIQIKVDPDETPNKLVLEASISPFDILGIGGEPYIQGSGFQLTTETRNLQLSQPFGDLVAHIVIPDSHIPDLTVYNQYLPAKTSLEVIGGEGRLTAEFDFDASAHKGRGKIHLRGEQVRASVEELPMAGGFHLETKMISDDLTQRKFQLDGTRLVMMDVHTGEGKQESGPWEGQITVEAGEMVWRKPLEVEALLNFDLQDSSPLVAIMAKRRKLVAWSKDLLTVENLLGKGHLKMKHRAMIVSPFQVTGEKLEMLGQLKFEENVAHGKMFIAFKGLHLGVAFENGQRDLKFIKARKWYENYPNLPETGSID